MNTNALVKNYGSLTPEERFRLIMAAGSRGDEAEGNRVMLAGKRITLSVPDYAPYAHAFHELLFLTYIELLEDAAFYQECNALASKEIRDSVEAAPKPKKKRATAIAKDRTREDANVDYPAWHRIFRTAYAAGFLLNVKVEGWKVFCTGLNVAPIALWEQADFPGLDRLKRVLALANAGVAFPSAAEMACWVNEVRPAGHPEHPEADVTTAELFAASLDRTFRERVRWWGG